MVRLGLGWDDPTVTQVGNLVSVNGISHFAMVVESDVFGKGSVADPRDTVITDY